MDPDPTFHFYEQKYIIFVFFKSSLKCLISPVRVRVWFTNKNIFLKSVCSMFLLKQIVKKNIPDPGFLCKIIWIRLDPDP